MEKDILIDLFDRKDKKRRRVLYEHYHNLITNIYSAVYAAEAISKDLERPGLVTARDIKFCRYQFKGKKVGRSSVVAASNNINNIKEISPATNIGRQALHWSDPTELEGEDSIIVKSKHAKK